MLCDSRAGHSERTDRSLRIRILLTVSRRLEVTGLPTELDPVQVANRALSIVS